MGNNIHEFLNIPIYCPECSFKVMTYRGGSITRSAKCQKCKRLVTYKPVEDVTEVSEVPETRNGGGRMY